MLLTSAILSAPSGENVLFPPGLYSMSEVCQRLSQGSRTVTCSTALQGRVAVVSLRSRAWSDAVAILSKGLGVQVVEDGGKCLTMEESPIVSRVERKLLSLYAGLFDSSINSAIKGATTLAAQLDLSKESDLIALRTLAQDRDAIPTMAASARFLLARAGRANADALSTSYFLSGGGLRDLISHDFVWSGTPAEYDQVNAVTASPASLLAQIRSVTGLNIISSEEADRQTSRLYSDGAIVWRLTFSPLDEIITTSGSFALSPTRPNPPWSAGYFIPEAVERPNTDLRNLFSGATLQAFLARRALTAGILQSAPAVKALKADGECSLAKFCAKWATSQESEVVMDVSSVRDRLASTSPEISLGDALTQSSASGRIPNSERIVSSVVLPPDTSPSLREWRDLRLDRAREGVKSRSSWTASQMNGVLLIKNEYSFLDHQYPLPRTVAKLSKTNTSRLCNVKDLVSYAAETSRIENARLARVDCPLLPTGTAEAYPFLKLIGSLTPAQRSTLTELLSKNGEYSCPMRSFDGTHLGVFLGDWSALISQGTGWWDVHGGFADAFLREAGSADAIMRSKLEVKCDNIDDGSLTFRLVGQGNEPEGVTLLFAALTHVRLREPHTG